MFTIEEAKEIDVINLVGRFSPVRMGVFQIKLESKMLSLFLA